MTHWAVETNFEFDRAGLAAAPSARNFLVSRLRADGATFKLQGATFEVPSNAAVEVIIDEPSIDRGDSAWRDDIFAAAIEAWEINDVHVSTLDRFLADARDANLNTVS